jgi:hypothetical protein
MAWFSGRTIRVAVLLVAGLAIGACTNQASSDSQIDTPYLSGQPESFLGLGASAYLIDGVYVESDGDDQFEDFIALVVDIELPEFLGDDSPGVQDPPPVLAPGDQIRLRVHEFDVTNSLTPGDRILAIVAHNSNLDPPWTTAAIASWTGSGFHMIGGNADKLAVELAVAATTLNSDPETAFVTLAREIFSSDMKIQQGSERRTTYGPALAAIAGVQQAASDPTVIWNESDPTQRALQRGTAPDDLLDTLPEMSVIYTFTSEFSTAYPDTLVMVRNNLGITSSVASDLYGASDSIFGSPGNPFEVTIAQPDQLAAATVIGFIDSSDWEGQYAIAVEVTTTEDGTPKASVKSLTQEQFAALIGG